MKKCFCGRTTELKSDVCFAHSGLSFNRGGVGPPHQLKLKESNTMETGRIENGFYVQGDLSFKIDTTDAHKTFDAVGALSHADKLTLAKLNNIPAEPYNKQLLTNVLKSVVQNVWFAAKQGVVPVEVMTGHNARLQRYHAEIAIPTNAVDFLAKKTRVAKAARPSLLFSLDPLKYEAVWREWRGQRALVIRSMQELLTHVPQGSGVTIRQILENVKETRETTLPTRNAVGQIVNALKEAGIVTCLNPEAAKAPRTQAVPATPKTTPPAAKAIPASQVVKNKKR
jgi:hypothetical protein